MTQLEEAADAYHEAKKAWRIGEAMPPIGGGGGDVSNRSLDVVLFGLFDHANYSNGRGSRPSVATLAKHDRRNPLSEATVKRALRVHEARGNIHPVTARRGGFTPGGRGVATEWQMLCFPLGYGLEEHWLSVRNLARVGLTRADVNQAMFATPEDPLREHADELYTEMSWLLDEAAPSEDILTETVRLLDQGLSTSALAVHLAERRSMEEDAYAEAHPDSHHSGIRSPQGFIHAELRKLGQNTRRRSELLEKWPLDLDQALKSDSTLARRLLLE